MKQYVVGFMFDTAGENVALVRKERPEWQKGRLNGIGGHIEEGETPLLTMVREFKEETGYQTSPNQWDFFCSVDGLGWTVYFFHTRGHLQELQSVTDEKIEVVPICYVTADKQPIPTIQNLRWLVPMALSKDDLIAEVHEL